MGNKQMQHDAHVRRYIAYCILMAATGHPLAGWLPAA